MKNNLLIFTTAIGLFACGDQSNEVAEKEKPVERKEISLESYPEVRKDTVSDNYF